MKKLQLIIFAMISLVACKQPVTNPETPIDPTATAVYVKGFRIENIYLVNLMYRVELIGSMKMAGDKMLAQTDYTSIMLNKSIIPYYIPLSSPILIGEFPNPFDWYTTFQINAYAAARETAEGAQVLSVTIPADILEGQKEMTATSSTNPTSVTILFEYK